MHLDFDISFLVISRPKMVSSWLNRNLCISILYKIPVKFILL